MSNRQDDDVPASFASPPCFMHELNPNYLGLTGTSDCRQRVDVERWRIAQCDTLIAAIHAPKPTIYPQPHDIAMDLVVTEVGITRPPTEQGR